MKLQHVAPKGTGRGRQNKKGPVVKAGPLNIKIRITIDELIWPLWYTLAFRFRGRLQSRHRNNRLHEKLLNADLHDEGEPEHAAIERDFEPRAFAKAE